MTTEYLFTTLPKGVVPKTVGFEAVVSMELTELAALGWQVVTATRQAGGFTPLEVLLERKSE